MPPPAQANPAHDPPAPANGGPANGPANGTAPPKKPSPKAAAGPMKKTAKTSQKAAAAEKDDSATTEPRRAARAEPLADAAARAKFGALSAEKRVADCLHREHWEDLYSLFCSLDAEKRYGIVEGYMEKTKFPMDVTRNKVFADRTVERGEEGQQSKKREYFNLGTMPHRGERGGKGMLSVATDEEQGRHLTLLVNALIEADSSEKFGDSFDPWWYSTVTVNRSGHTQLHVDSGNFGPSRVFALGCFCGGRTFIYAGPDALKEKENVQWLLVDKSQSEAQAKIITHIMNTPNTLRKKVGGTMSAACSAAASSGGAAASSSAAPNSVVSAGAEKEAYELQPYVVRLVVEEKVDQENGDQEQLKMSDEMYVVDSAFLQSDAGFGAQRFFVPFKLAGGRHVGVDFDGRDPHTTGPTFPVHLKEERRTDYEEIQTPSRMAEILDECNDSQIPWQKEAVGKKTLFERFCLVAYPHQSAQRLGKNTAAVAASWGFRRLHDERWKEHREKLAEAFQRDLGAYGTQRAGTEIEEADGTLKKVTTTGVRVNGKGQKTEETMRAVRAQNEAKIVELRGEEELEKLKTNTKDFQRVYVPDRDVPVEMYNDLLHSWGVVDLLKKCWEGKKAADPAKTKDWKAWFDDVTGKGRDLMRTAEGRKGTPYGDFAWRQFPDSWWWLKSDFGGPKLDAYKKLFLETASNAFSLSKSDTLQKIFKFLPDRKDPDASTWHNTGSRLTAQRDAMTKLGLDPLAWKDEHTEFDKKSMDFKKKEKAKATDAKAKSSKAESSKAGGQKAGGQLPSRVVGPKRAGGADDAGGKSAGEDEVDDPLDDIPKPKAKGRAKGKAAAAKGKAAARKRKAEGNDEDAEPDAKKPKQD